ncbi:toll/interleukin-1 receptor domain-containing protein [Catenulispora sp. NL8]|uniref:Toll/interleukin-1 receptor domain-containing protein n=1 Tax=Catenulispora pinistramenti TaxID=2705254 RepID=A0ABS5KRJ9_9ACTN|nr:toll/interleukin-1 receptor domain-containing protein [Catenulispora pinistramenti]MBS2548640.1 toll/interleukin-1 receptor domain-containing protein [Catenulispora pinistramenti]
MSGLHLPGLGNLPAGALRDLTEALHELYRDAGTPGLRKIATAVNEDDRFRDTVSHQKVSAMLHGDGAPKWSKLEPVVLLLAQWSTPRRDPREEAKRFKHLWDTVSADEAGEAADKPPDRRVSGRLRSAFILGGVTGETTFPDFEPAELDHFCQRLGATVARAGADLIICSPFPDSADFHALRGYVESGTGHTIHMHRPQHQTVDNQYAQLREVIGPEATARIKNWYYPAPEKDDRESMLQAWVLCQLMAMEHADVILAVGGKPGGTAATILHLAEARAQLVVPFAFLGGAAGRAYARRDWEAIYPRLDARLLNKKSGAEDAMVIAEQMAMSRVRLWHGLQGRPRTAFISRARPDSAYARALDSYLSGVGMSVVFGERDLPTDRTVESAIDDAVLQSDLFIALWSRSYAASRYCYDELHLALHRHRAGALRLWIINLDGSDIVPLEARKMPQLVARTPEDIVSVVRDLLMDEFDV